MNSAGKEHKALINKFPAKKGGNRSTWWIAAGLLLLVALVFIFRSILFKENNTASEETRTEGARSLVTVEEILAPAQANLDSEDKIFYRELNSALWNYLHHKVGLSGSQMSKDVAKKVLLAKHVRPGLVDDMIAVIEHSEIGSYTGAQMNLNKTEMFQKAKDILHAIGI